MRKKNSVTHTLQVDTCKYYECIGENENSSTNYGMPFQCVKVLVRVKEVFDEKIVVLVGEAMTDTAAVICGDSNNGSRGGNNGNRRDGNGLRGGI